MSISLGKKLHFSLSLKIPQMNNGVMRLSYRLLLLTNIDLGPDHLLSIISIILDEFKLVCKLGLNSNSNLIFQHEDFCFDCLLIFIMDHIDYISIEQVVRA